jgi:probable HAF family extracellular repeat protein
MTRTALLAIVVLVCSSGVAHAVTATATFIPLGDLSGGALNSRAFGVSADGTTVVGLATSATGPQAFRWTAATGLVGLGDFTGGAFNSVANSVSADGSVVVGRGTSADGATAFRWTEGEGLVSLGDLPDGPFSSEAHDVSADGTVVVGRGRSALSNEAFRWTANGGMVGLGFLPSRGGGGSLATAASADGSVVVGDSFVDGIQYPFRWTVGGGMTQLFPLPTPDIVTAVPVDVSADGSTVVGWGFVGTQAFRWTEATGPVIIPRGNLSEILFKAVSGDGAVVVGTAFTAGDGFDMYWDANGGVRPLADVLTARGADLTGWTLYEALDISPDGRTIVGYGRGPSGGVEAFLARAVPEPTAGLLAALTAGAIVCCRSRKLAISR